MKLMISQLFTAYLFKIENGRKARLQQNFFVCCHEVKRQAFGIADKSRRVFFWSLEIWSFRAFQKSVE